MKSFTWDGTENGLERLLIWWVTVENDYHDYTVEEILDGELKCFQPMPYESNAAVGMEARLTKRGDPLPLYFEFTKGKRAGTKYDLNPGDTIFYEDGKFSFKESFECVVISQDWP